MLAFPTQARKAAPIIRWVHWLTFLPVKGSQQPVIILNIFLEPCFRKWCHLLSNISLVLPCSDYYTNISLEQQLALVMDWCKAAWELQPTRVTYAALALMYGVVYHWEEPLGWSIPLETAQPYDGQPWDDASLLWTLMGCFTLPTRAARGVLGQPLVPLSFGWLGVPPGPTCSGSEEGHVAGAGCLQRTN